MFFSLIYFFAPFSIFYILHNYVILQAVPHAIPQTHSAFYPHRSYTNYSFDLNLGRGLCIFTSFHFPDSGLYLSNGFDFYLDLVWMAWHWKSAIKRATCLNTPTCGLPPVFSAQWTDTERCSRFTDFKNRLEEWYTFWALDERHV